MTSLWIVIPLLPVSLLGIIVNAYILLVVLFSRQATTANSLLLLHLGALNVLLGIIFLLFSAPGVIIDQWFSSGWMCHIHGFLFSFLHPLVLWTICGLNADRYYAIAAPLHYGHLVNPKKVLVCLGVGWLVSFTLSLPPFFFSSPFSFNKGLGACVFDFSLGQNVLFYTATYTAFTLLLPATLIICCNVKILMIARYHRHRIASAIYEVTLSAQVTITHQRNPFFVPTVTAPTAGGPKFRSRSPVSTLLQLLGSFFILYLPYYVVIMWQSSITLLLVPKVPQVHSTVFQVILVLLTISPTVNGCLYGLKNKMLRKTFQNYWRKKVTKSEVNNEIQARTPSTCGSRRQSLTPLGFFTRPNAPRRLSEALLDINKVTGSPTRPKMKRIASELGWRPNSTIGINYSPGENHTKIPHTSSCNILQVPKADTNEVFLEDEFCNKKSKNLSVTNLFMQRFFGFEEVLKIPTPRSPKILITRALSEDSDKSQPHTPSRELGKKHSNSATNLLEKKWRQMKIKEGEINDMPTSKTKLLDRSSDSSEASDASSGLYVNLDLHEDVRQGKFLEERALLSWAPNDDMFSEDCPKKPALSVQSQEIIL